MDVAGTAARSVASLVKNREGDKESLQTHEHQSQKICIYQSAIYQVTNISAFGFSLGLHVCRTNPWIELLQSLPGNPSTKEK